MTNRHSKSIEIMKSLRFGIEIETIKLGHRELAEAIAEATGGHAARDYRSWGVTLADGRRWKVVDDGSLRSPNGRSGELVSPILTYADIPTLQEIVRAVRRAGARVNTSCGIHIHIDAARFDAKALRHLTKTVNKQERLIEEALNISESRRNRFCRGINQSFLRRIERERPTELRALNAAWYGYQNTSPYHYDDTRYHGLNLHNVWYRGTVEYRWFDSTLHAGKVKAYIQFVLALSARAISAKATSSARRPFSEQTAKYDFRNFLLRLGLIGDEFKTARLHLMAHLKGSAAWKHGRPEAAAPAATPTTTAGA